MKRISRPTIEDEVIQTEVWYIALSIEKFDSLTGNYAQYDVTITVVNNLKVLLY